ncbi:hypothetical protein L7F22_004093 [Adiantum nelumboides]|nr:hypothetical protein [Adiantum nelumboides]
MKERNTSWEAHAIHVKPSSGKTKCFDWTCRYCGKSTSSGLTRFEEHLARLPGQIKRCPKVPKDVQMAVIESIQSNPNRKKTVIIGEDGEPRFVSREARGNAPSATATSYSPAASTAAHPSSSAANASSSGGPSFFPASTQSAHMKQPSLAEVTVGSSSNGSVHNVDGVGGVIIGFKQRNATDNLQRRILGEGSGYRDYDHASLPSSTHDGYEGATLGLLVHFMRAAMDEMKACNLLAPNEKRDVISKVEERWTWMRRPIHGLAALLHPAYKAPELFTDAELLADRDAFLPKALTEEEHGKFLEELIAYNDQRGGPAFASPTTWKREYLVKPLFWWDSFGYGHRSLQKVAMRLLAQDCSSGACERSWSSYSLIHTKIRNRLSTKQLERLVYCRSNMRMLAAMHKLDHAKQVNVDDFKLTGDTLQSVNKEVDVEEERIYAELYQELEEIDRRVSRTRHGRERGEQARTTTSRRGRGRGPRGRGGRRGSGSSSAAYEHEDDPIESSDEDVREPEYDDDGNLLSEPDFPSGSKIEASASPMLHDDSDDDSFTLSP